MAVAAEVLESSTTGEWLLARQAFPELDRQAQLRTAQWLGNVVLHGEVQVEPLAEMANESTLLAAIQQAALGDKDSERVVETNIATDVVERSFKIGITRVKMQFVNGHLMQFGRRASDMPRNTLQHTILNSEMTYRTKAEAGNVFLFEEMYKAGLLKTHNAVLFSPASEDQKTLEDYNFFLGTESCSIQMLSANGDDVTLESALVAGKRTPDSPRHDIEAIHKLAAESGVELATNDTGEILQCVMLVPKEQTKNGVGDIVKRYDAASGGTFYGEAKPQRDYQVFAAECEERQTSFASVVQDIKDQLLREAHLFKTPFEAIERLDHLSERLCVKHARYDTSIDAAVFGATAAMHIEEARFFHSIGEHDRAEKSVRAAQKTATSGSCPLRLKGDGQDAVGTGGSGAELQDREGKSEKKWMNCPYCSAKVYADPCAKKLSCWDCKASVVNGKVVSKGNGGSQKRLAEEKAQEAVADKTPAFDQEAKILLETEKLKEQATGAGKVALAGVQ